MLAVLRRLIKGSRAAWLWWQSEIGRVFDVGLGWKPTVRDLPAVRLFANGEHELLSDGEAISSENEYVKGASRGLSVALSLPSEWVLRKTLDLPIKASARAHEAVGLMMERLSPFSRDQVYYDLQPNRRDRAHGVARFEIAITPRARTDAAMARISGLGMLPVRVEASDPECDRAFIFAEATSDGKFRRPDRISRMLFAAAAGLIVVGAPALVAALQFQAAALKAEIATLKSAAETARDVSADLAKQMLMLEDWRDFVAGPKLSAVLEVLSQRVSDDAWLFSLEYDSKNLTLHGVARDVPALLARISGPPFSIGQLEGAVVAGQFATGDRFDVKLPVQESAP